MTKEPTVNDREKVGMNETKTENRNCETTKEKSVVKNENVSWSDVKNVRRKMAVTRKDVVEKENVEKDNRVRLKSMKAEVGRDIAKERRIEKRKRNESVAEKGNEVGVLIVRVGKEVEAKTDLAVKEA